MGFCNKKKKPIKKKPKTEYIDKFSIQKTIHEKIYCHDTEYEKILGIRNILGNNNN